MNDKRDHEDKKNKEGHVLADNTLMDRLGRENVLPDGMLFEVDETQRISEILAEESVEKPLDIDKKRG